MLTRGLGTVASTVRTFEMFEFEFFISDLNPNIHSDRSAGNITNRALASWMLGIIWTPKLLKSTPQDIQFFFCGGVVL